MRALTLTDRVKIPEDVVFQNVGEETVLLNFETGVYYGLDAIGTRVWELLSKKGNLGGVFDDMIDEYEVAPQDLKRDILRLVEELQAKSLIEVLE